MPNHSKMQTLAWWNRIKFRLLFFGIIMSIVPVYMMGWYNIETTKNSLEESIQTKQLYVVQRAASDVDNLLLSIKGRMELLMNANDKNITNSDSIEKWEKSLYGFLKQNVEIENAYIFNNNGTVLASAQRWDVVSPKSIPEEQLSRMKNYVASNSTCTVGEIFFKEDGTPYVNMGIPFYSPDQRTFLGGIILQVNLRSTFKKISALSSGKDGYIYIINKDNRLIAHTDYSQVLLEKQVVQALELKNMLKNRDKLNKSTQYDSYTGERVIGAYAPITTTNWVVVVEQPIHQAYAPVDILVRRLMITMAIVIGLVVFISIVFGVWFIKPIELMGKAVEKVRSGKLDTKVDYQINDEFGRLAEAFNHMTTELKVKSEHLEQEKERLDTIVNGSGAGFALVYDDYSIAWMNERLKQWLNTDKKGQLCYNLLGGYNKPCEDCPLTLKNLEHCQNEVITSMDEMGNKKIFSHRMYPLERVSEGEAQFLVVVEDITEQRQLEEMVEQADKLSALGILASGFAHEVNNPLASISAYAEDLKERIREENTDELVHTGEMDYYLDIIQNNVDRCKVITSNLLNFSRKASLTSVDTEIVQTVEDSILLLKHSIKKKSIKLEKNFITVPKIKLDSLQLQQVIVNLIQNAIDAVEEGGSIQISTNLLEDQIEIRVKDNGCGIEQEQMNKVFDPFFTTKAVGKGTGLGMYISYNIIKRMNGNIIIESEKGVGTTVSIRLPYPKMGIEVV